MKKILMLLGIFASYINIFAADGCDMDLYPMSNTTSPIELWGESYQPCYMYEWNITFPTDWHYVEFCYTIDMNPMGAMDAVMIYIQDENGQEHDIISYPYKPITGCITVPLHTNSARIVCLSEYGNAGGLYRGFKLHYRQGNATPSNHVFFSNVGIGTYPMETLHVNGAIRGGGTNGEVTLKGDNGYVTIGATSQAMEFNTNKSKFVLNKPIYSYNGIFASSDSVDLYFKTNHNTRMTILESNGNVGIGTTIPQGRLHVNNGHLRIGNGTSESSRSANVLLFGDNTHVQIGEWQADNMLSFQANTYNFTTGNVGIGTTSPSYKLDVNGTIRANEIIVNTTGADFVFADDYQLRPLSEVKAFIQENKHLPEIQSAQEMQENGVGVNELQTQLLQKIEELTLYLIQQEQTIQELRQEVEQLKK